MKRIKSGQTLSGMGFWFAGIAILERHRLFDHLYLFEATLCLPLAPAS